MSAIDEIKSRMDVVDYISQTVKLRHAGKNYTGFCPFHQNTRTPAFVVFPETGTWRCFGQCNEGGDIFRFVMKKEGMDFSQALKYLAEKTGVVLEPMTPQKQEQEDRQERLQNLLEQVVLFFRNHLIQPGGKTALEYLYRRGLTDATIETFGLGFAPDSWDSLISHFTGKGYTRDDLLDAGLVTERQDGSGYYDKFRKRIMFPVRDKEGRMAGFGGRILDPNDIPKFMNSPQTMLFDKSRLLYGLNTALPAIRSHDQAVIVEGYLDVIILQQAGFKNTVSPMGTALTETQLKLIHRYVRKIILALDADSAGEKATLRGLEIARQTLEREEEINADAAGIFSPRGLIKTEARMKTDIRVTSIPEGMDPDEVVLRNPDEWRQILDQAQPVVVHVMRTLAQGQDLKDPKVKTEIANQVIPLIEDIASPIERDTYRQQLARLLQVDESALQVNSGRSFPARPRPKRNSRADVPSPAEKLILNSSSSAILERHLLGILLINPDMVYTLNRLLQRAHLSVFTADEMENSEHQSLARGILTALDQEKMDPSHFLKQELSGELAELAGQLTGGVNIQGFTMTQLAEDVFRTLVRKRQNQIQADIRQLRFLQQDLQPEELNMLQGINERIVQEIQILAHLNRALDEPFFLE